MQCRALELENSFLLAVPGSFTCAAERVACFLEESTNVAHIPFHKACSHEVMPDRSPHIIAMVVVAVAVSAASVLGSLFLWKKAGTTHSKDPDGSAPAKVLTLYH